jgi:23S rRNA (cytidine2498-2'-O)-methyltransferase
MGVPHEQPWGVLISTSPAYFSSAETLLRRSTPHATLERLAPDTALLSLDGDEADHVAEVIRADVPFVRHMGFGVHRIGASGAVTPDSVAEQVAATVPPEESSVSLQVWASGDAPLDPTKTRRVIERAIRGLGIDVQYGGRQRVVGVYMCASKIVVTITPLEDALCDWPGGRMRFKAKPAQISRAEFKLEEVLALCPMDVPERASALDLGASPGGWTRILLEKGLTVWAVDPGSLDARVASDPRVTYRRATANRFLSETRDLPRFQLVVNDMRMAPELSCELMVKASTILEPRGHVVLTLKVTPRTALDSLQHSREILQRAFDILFVRQLFHNRNELTLVARKRPSRR